MLYIEHIDTFVLLLYMLILFISLIFWWQLKLQINFMSQWGHCSFSCLREYSEGPEAFWYVLLGSPKVFYHELCCLLLVYILLVFSVLSSPPFNIRRKLD